MSTDTKALLDGVRERLHRLAKRNDLPTGLREWLLLCASETGTAADRLAALEEESAALKWLEDESCDLRCYNSPTGGDDYEIVWRVSEHHMDEPQERVIGYGETPLRAINEAKRNLAGGAQ